MLSAIGQEVNKFSRVMFVHVYRDGNVSADALANFSFVQEEMVFDKPPVVLIGFCSWMYGCIVPKIYSDIVIEMG